MLTKSVEGVKIMLYNNIMGEIIWENYSVTKIRLS